MTLTAIRPDQHTKSPCHPHTQWTETWGTPKGVTAFAVAPGFVDTPFNAPAVAEHGMELFVNDTALGEVAQPQDVANVIAFLASGKARHATGATIDVNTASYVR